MTAFWDASAIVPLCIATQAGARGRQLLRESKPVVWWATPVEVGRAFARLRRQGDLTEAQSASAHARLRVLRMAWREVDPSSEVRDLAEMEVGRGNLRAADALQLAAALVWAGNRPRGRRFICRDQRLGAAAQSAGFDVLSW